uniref:Uncharacterized protein n=1 Tax=Knipowitschia caucasica TaxID=637954 RepID=A0AAV2LTN0_KNICA
MARETLRNDYMYPIDSGNIKPTTALVQSISEGTSWQRTIDRLAEDMKEMRTDVRKLSEENERLRQGARDGSSTTHQRCQCRCGARGCQSLRSWSEPRGRSPEAGWQQRRGEKYSGPERRSPSPYNRRSSSPYNSRSDSPGRQNLKPTGDVVFNAPEQRRGVRFLSPDNHQQGNGM